MLSFPPRSLALNVGSLFSARVSCCPRVLLLHRCSRPIIPWSVFFPTWSCGLGVEDLETEETKIKNFTSCFKDKAFLDFFFKRLRARRPDDGHPDYPFVSPCGRELNFIKSENTPIVYTELRPSKSNDKHVLIWGGTMEVICSCYERFRPRVLADRAICRSSLSQTKSMSVHQDICTILFPLDVEPVLRTWPC